MLASFLLGRPVKWIEDRRENLLSAGHSRNESRDVRMAVDDDGDHPGHHRRPRVRRRRVRSVCPAAHRTRCCCPGSVQDAPARVLHARWCWTNTMGKAAYRGPVDVRDHRARDGDRLRRRARSASTRSSSGAATCSPRPTCRSPSPSGNVVPGDHARSRRSSRRSRSSTTRRSARSRPRRAPRVGYLGVGHRARTWSRRRWAATRWPPRRRRSGRDRAGAVDGLPRHRRRTARASRPRWRRSSPTQLGVDYDDVTIVQADIAVDAVRTRHRRQPHRGRSPAARRARPPSRVRDKVLRDRRAPDGSGARRPRDRRRASSRCGARRRSR